MSFKIRMVNISVKAKSYLAQIPSHIKTSVYPLTELDTKRLETFQKDLKVFKGVKMTEIAFMTKKLDTINLLRGCKLGCTHCPKNALSPAFGRETILYEDLKALVSGFKVLSERLGFDVLNGNKALNIVEDSNPFSAQIKGLKREHSVLEAMNYIYTYLRIPINVKTSVLNGIGSSDFHKIRSVVRHFVERVKKVPDEFNDIQISFNPFLKDEPMYVKNMALTLNSFLDLFRIEKAKINYQYAQDGYTGYDKIGARSLYEQVYAELQRISDSNLESIPQLHPDNVIKPSLLNRIQPVGRGKNFFNQQTNERFTNELAKEEEKFNLLLPEEKREFLLDNALKKVDIDGTVYTTMPVRTNYTSVPIEMPESTGIKLNFKNIRQPNKVYNPLEVQKYFK